MRRNLLLLALLCAPLGACATGYAADWFRDRPEIINPQLLRYGLDLEQSRCVSERLGRRLTRSQVGLLQQRAAAVQPAGSNAAPLTLTNLRAIASGMKDRVVRLELDASVAACNVPATPTLAATAAPSGPSAVARSGSVPLTSGGVPVDMTPRSATLPTTWLNLGSAESGQAIAIDAASIQQEGAGRTAWFRMTDPESGAPTTNNYRLRIDCQAKTVQPLALRQTNAAGAQVSLREYTPEEAKAGPAESGTVLEIAYLSLCT
jgi:hypothetical protein